MLHHLEELAEKLDIEVCYQSAAGRVGVCTLRGRRVAIVDSNLRVPDRVAALLSVLADEDLNGVYMPPAIRSELVGSDPLLVKPSAEDGDTAAGQEGRTGDVRESGTDPEADAD
jgi:hypothetical protein